MTCFEMLAFTYDILAVMYCMWNTIDSSVDHTEEHVDLHAIPNSEPAYTAVIDVYQISHIDLHVRPDSQLTDVNEFEVLLQLAIEFTMNSIVDATFNPEVVVPTMRFYFDPDDSSNPEVCQSND